MSKILSLKTLSLGLISLSLVACGGGTGGSGSAHLEDSLQKGELLATQNGVQIHQGYLNLLEVMNPQIESQISNPEGKRRIISKLMEQELLYQEAIKQGLDKDPELQQKAALYSRMIYAQGALEKALDQQAEEEYKKNQEQFAEVELAHILIKIPRKLPEGQSEADLKKKAEEAKAKLDGGADWESVMKEYSEDKISLRNGGSMGKLSLQDRRVERLQWKDMIETAFKLQEGAIAGPFQAKDGFHIIKVVKDKSLPPFEEVKQRLQFQLKNKVKDDLLAKISQGKPITYEGSLKQEDKKPDAAKKESASTQEKSPTQKIKEGAKEMGEGLKEGAKQAGSAVKEAAETVKEKVSN
ncbi:MAG: peptidylprolyl isomerase [Deltaproteobacteria bacterium]|nr:peptidylprolyl isomerase [Deltaproteobacteria bacterium]